MTLRVAILISGGGSNMVALARSMRGDHPARPCLVISNRPDAGGLARAADMGIATDIIDHTDYGSRRAFEAALHDRLVTASPDFICLAGFMRVLSAEFLAPWSGQVLNIHPSLLPDYRGLNTHARALAAGARVHGCTVHEVTPELDGGPILGQAALDIRDDDTPERLAARVLRLEHRLYPEVLRRVVEGDRRPITWPADASE